MVVAASASKKCARRLVTQEGHTRELWPQWAGMTIAMAYTAGLAGTILQPRFLRDRGFAVARIHRGWEDTRALIICLPAFASLVLAFLALALRLRKAQRPRGMPDHKSLGSEGPAARFRFQMWRQLAFVTQRLLAALALMEALYTLRVAHPVLPTMLQNVLSEESLFAIYEGAIRIFGCTACHCLYTASMWVAAKQHPDKDDEAGQEQKEGGIDNQEHSGAATTSSSNGQTGADQLVASLLDDVRHDTNAPSTSTSSANKVQAATGSSSSSSTSSKSSDTGKQGGGKEKEKAKAEAKAEPKACASSPTGLAKAGNQPLEDLFFHNNRAFVLRFAAWLIASTLRPSSSYSNDQTFMFSALVSESLVAIVTLGPHIRGERSLCLAVFSLACTPIHGLVIAPVAHSLTNDWGAPIARLTDTVFLVLAGVLPLLLLTQWTLAQRPALPKAKAKTKAMSQPAETAGARKQTPAANASHGNMPLKD